MSCSSIFSFLRTGSELSDGAIQHGVEFAKDISARVTLLPRPAFTIIAQRWIRLIRLTSAQRHAKQRATHALSKGAECAREAGVGYDTTDVEHDHPYQADHPGCGGEGLRPRCGATLRRRRGLSAAMLGSQTVSVLLTHSSIPVFVYRRHRDGTRGAARGERKRTERSNRRTEAIRLRTTRFLTREAPVPVHRTRHAKLPILSAPSAAAKRCRSKLHCGSPSTKLTD